MKKTLCWLIVLAMLVAMAPAVFAAEATNVLVDGNNDFEMAKNVDTMEFTYTAASAGVLTVEFTKMAYLSSTGDATNKPVDEAFAGANDTSIWFEAYINGEKLTDLYKGSVNVEANETVTIELKQVGGTFFISRVRQGSVNITLGEGSQGGDEPAGNANEIAVTTTDNYGYFDLYTFTAEVAGAYTFNIPAGLGVVTPAALESWGDPIIDYNANESGYVYEKEMAAGEKFEFYVGSTEKADWVITYTVVASEEQPGEGGGEEPLPTATPVAAGNSTIDSDVLYAFTAEEAGILTIDASTGTMAYGAFQSSVYTYGSLILEVDGVAVDALAQGVYELEVAANQVVTIQVKAGMAMYQGSKINLVLTMAEPPAPAVILGTNAADANVLYQYTAEADGKLTIDATSGTMQYGPFNSSVYPNGALVLEVNGVAVDSSARGLYELDVTAGQVVTIQVKSLNPMYTTAKINLVLSQAEGGEQPSDGPVEITGSNLAIGGNNSINAKDVNFVYTAAADGTLTLNMGNAIMGAVEAVVYVNGLNPQNLYAGSSLELTLSAGDKVGIVVTAKGYATLTAAWTEGGADNPPEEDNNGTGTKDDPIIIDEVPYENNEHSGDLYYQWTATASGTVNLTYSSGVGTLKNLTTNVSGDYLENGKSVKVSAGDVIEINYWNGNAFSVTFAEDSGEVEPGTDAQHPIILEDGESVTLNRGNNGKFYAWTAAADGKFIVEITSNSFTYGYTLKVNGVEMGYGTNEQIFDVQAGDLIVIEWTASPSAASSWNLVIKGAMDDGKCRHEYDENGICIKCGAEHEADGTAQYPFIIDGPGTYSFETLPLCYKYVATEKVTLIITVNKKNSHMLGSVAGHLSNSNVVDGDYRIYTIEVEAGSTLTFKVMTLGSVKTGEFTVAYKQECQHANTAERQENVVDATCAAAGSYDKVTYCVDCEAVISTEKVNTEKLDHTHAERNENVVEATCAAGGSYDKVTYCSVCDEEISRESITTEALEHSYQDGVCGNCGAEDPNYQPPENPNPGTGSVDVLAIVLITMMSVVAIVTVTTKKAYKA